MVAYKNKVSLSGVGFDIACGNKACQTNIRATDIDKAVALVHNSIWLWLLAVAGVSVFAHA